MTSLRIVFLGTSAAVPQKNRFLSSIAMQRDNGEIFLFDCGEGTQYQMLRFNINFQKITKVFFSHFHGDHWFGILGLLNTMNQMERTTPLTIYGPIGAKSLFDTFFGSRENLGFRYPIDVHDVDEGFICEEEDYRIFAKRTKHKVLTLAYGYFEKERLGRFHKEKALQLKVQRDKWQKLQKGLSVLSEENKVITPDMVLGPARRGFKLIFGADGIYEKEDFVPFALEADILILEATYDDEKEEQAIENCHSTARWSAQIASAAKVKKLYLTHISPRYKEDNILLEKQAQEEFPGTIIAYDGLEIHLNRKDLED